jgi:predicted nucleotidyltransferase
MTSEEVIGAVVDGLETLSIPYMLVGSFSSNYYGIGRSTNDADFVVQLESESLSSLAKLLGPAFRLDPQMTFESITMTRLFNREINLPTVEDVVITKLRWALTAKRSKDADDVRAVIAIQSQNIDWFYIHAWCDQHGTRALLDQIRSSIPPL